MRRKPKDNKGSDSAAKVDQEIIIHNMPSQSRFSASGSLAAKPQVGSMGLGASPKRNFKAVGLLIIAGGLVVIGSLVYASYRFIVKPAMKTGAPDILVSTSQSPNQNRTATATTAVVPTATTPIVTSTTPIEVIDLNPAASTSTPETVSSLPPLLDTDEDGLWDDEEAVLGTNASSTDTNGNSYQDLVEINNNYNPSGSGRLSANENLARYKDSVSGYELLYPKAWPTKSLNDETTVIFTAPDASLVQISVQDNADKQSILGWYEISFPDTVVTYDRLKNADGWEGVMGEDGRNFYLTDKKRQNIYVISYIPAVDDRIAYPNIFNLMINSFMVK